MLKIFIKFSQNIDWCLYSKPDGPLKYKLTERKWTNATQTSVIQGTNFGDSKWPISLIESYQFRRNTLTHFSETHLQIPVKHNTLLWETTTNIFVQHGDKVRWNPTRYFGFKATYFGETQHKFWWNILTNFCWPPQQISVWTITTNFGELQQQIWDTQRQISVKQNDQFQLQP